MNVPEVMSKWKTLLALTMALFALKFHLLLIWGLFCWFWGWKNLRAKEAFFVERIELKEHPVLFTLIIISWFVMGGVYFYMDNRVFEFFSSL
ncbi:hypothetical protein ACED33_17995 [Vibrio splendidus]|uniref:Uncharacterized protein n=1 Tax=Vibrio splendidus TaxID=29497 RepID=A0ABV4LVX9_VIBSP